MKNILILGGTGYIGNYLSSNLNKNYNVSIVGTQQRTNLLLVKRLIRKFLKILILCCTYHGVLI